MPRPLGPGYEADTPSCGPRGLAVRRDQQRRRTHGRPVGRAGRAAGADRVRRGLPRGGDLDLFERLGELTIRGPPPLLPADPRRRPEAVDAGHATLRDPPAGDVHREPGRALPERGAASHVVDGSHVSGEDRRRRAARFQKGMRRRVRRSGRSLRRSGRARPKET